MTSDAPPETRSDTNAWRRSWMPTPGISASTRTRSQKRERSAIRWPSTSPGNRTGSAFRRGRPAQADHPSRLADDHRCGDSHHSERCRHDDPCFANMQYSDEIMQSNQGKVAEGKGLVSNRLWALSAAQFNLPLPNRRCRIIALRRQISDANRLGKPVRDACVSLLIVCAGVRRRAASFRQLHRSRKQMVDPPEGCVENWMGASILRPTRPSRRFLATLK